MSALERRSTDRKVSHEQVSADTPNAVTTGPGPGRPQPCDNGIAHIRRDRSHLRASTKLQGADGASDLCTAGAGTESRRYHRVRDSRGKHVNMVARGFARARRHQD